MVSIVISFQHAQFKSLFEKTHQFYFAVKNYYNISNRPALLTLKMTIN